MLLYKILLHIHSLVRYVILLLPIFICIKLIFNNPKRVEDIDKKMLLWLMIAAHTQLVAGVLLYFQSPYVVFTEATMKVKDFRYWTVEHAPIMLAAIALITLARIAVKKPLEQRIQYRRAFLFTLFGWLLAVTGAALSGRGLLTFS